MWFQDPEIVIQDHWKLESYLVNGIDSSVSNSVKAYTESTATYFAGKSNNYFKLIFPTAVSAQGYWNLVNNKKEININTYGGGNLVIPSYGIQKNIFNDNSSENWTIKKLTAQQFWLNITYNGVNYEIHFKK